MTEIEEIAPETPAEDDAIPIVSLAEFLSNIPPYTQVVVSDYYSKDGMNYRRNRPRILLNCLNEKCKSKGELWFNSTTKGGDVPLTRGKIITLEYRCSNCQVCPKIFTILLVNEPDGTTLKANLIKLGELPAFGPPIPSQLMKMVGADRSLFLKGRRCENQGLGIASFAYYRRVIEDQKNRIFDEIIKVTKLLEPRSELIAELEKAKLETQFTKSVDTIKTAIPQSLKITGHNPLTLLHGALSEGLHAQSDEKCLEIASEVRIVLTQFAQQITDALIEKKEVQDAVRKLAQRQQAKGQ